MASLDQFQAPVSADIISLASLLLVLCSSSWSNRMASKSEYKKTNPPKSFPDLRSPLRCQIIALVLPVLSCSSHYGADIDTTA